MSFALGDWNVSRTINVSFANDNALQSAVRVTGSLQHVVDTAEMPVAFMPSSMLKIVRHDDDFPGVFLAPPEPPIVVEGQSNATYTAVLTAQPKHAVVVEVAVDAPDLAMVRPAVLRFDSEDWSTPQTITVVAKEDMRAAAGVSVLTLRHSMASNDSYFNSSSAFLPDRDVHLRRYDDDSAGVFISETLGDVVEDGLNFSYAVWLLSEPVHPVEVIVQNSWPAAIHVEPQLLYFDASNWSVAALVEVSAVKDDVFMSSPATAVLTHRASSWDPLYNGTGFTPTSTVSILRYDDDVPRIELSSTELAVVEGGAAATYNIRLSSIPSFPVEIQLSSGDPSLAQVEPSRIEIHASNWSSAAVVSVSAAEENRFRGAVRTVSIFHTATSQDPDYNSTEHILPTNQIHVQRFDNDVSRLELSAKHGWVVEGTLNFTYSVKLASEPSSNVTVFISFTSQLLATTRSSATFEPSRWNESVEVTVFAQEDVGFHGVENEVEVLHTASSADPFYNASEDVVSVTRVDNDEASIVVVPVELGISEGGSGTYSIHAASRPSSAIHISISSNDSSVTVSPSSLWLSPLNYSTPATITVSSQDDNLYWAGHLAEFRHIITEGDGWYTNSSFKPSATVLCAIYDDDVPRVKVSTNTLFVTEGGSSQSIDFALGSIPHSNVLLSFTITPATTKLRLSKQNLTFTAGSWQQWQSISVEAVDDDAVDGDTDEEFVITVSSTSSDADYGASALIVPSASIRVFRSDDERKHVWLKQPDLFVQEGKAISYSIVLTAQPTDDVTVVASGNAYVHISPSSVTFTTANWSSAAQVVVSAVDDEDFIAEERIVQILHSAVSADAAYNSPWAAFEPSSAAVVITVFDNDGTCQHPCNAGHYMAIVNSSRRCLPCQPGYFCSGDCELPQPCAPGKWFSRF